MRILFAGINANRIDILKTIEPGARSAQCFFIENFSSESIKEQYIYSIGSVILWKDYENAFSMLNAVKPDRLIYILLDNYYHFALFLAARKIGIPIYYLDHGIRYEDELEIMPYIDRQQTTALQRIFRKNILSGTFSFFKNTFYRNTLRILDPEVRKVGLRLFIQRNRKSYGNFMATCGKYLQPDYFIAYSQETMNFYRSFFHLPADYKNVTFTGIPSLDNFQTFYRTGKLLPKGILFIDQPLHEQKLMGWTKNDKLTFWKDFIAAAKDKGYNIYIKPHPWNEDYYSEIPGFADSGITILDQLESGLMEREIGLAGSFNSTLLLGFCALESLVTFCFEMHPAKGLPDFSKGITKYKVAARIDSFKTFEALLASPENELLKKKKVLPDFIKNVIYALDGNATTRLNNAFLANNEIS